MFTGIIQGQGRVAAIRPHGRESVLTIRALFALEKLVNGESIAVNGACLTVESGKDDFFTAYASAETLSRTNLSLLRPDAPVNLERALVIGQRLGGHLVTGHVDCLATVQSVRDAGRSLLVRLEFPAEYGELVIPKGSAALDGVSLTVNNCGDDFLETNVIPETRRATTIAAWAPGTRVNMETDLIGKYVRRMLAPRREGERPSLDENFLREHGFF
ncbi:MAG: riboflavin synthase [Deltaproteobacteria bacterium]|jgi:riboflavin synthase|nr:riboflavin synthase [Deltaproteobacteria bacterium]